ncbi:MAG: DUF3185 family protein [Thiomicrospira sp.]|uniref:DUF3185 family protein n=1 Tax=Thiomicrospira sp. TaxID=935 RepID=UPI001A109BE7|nr:DUF3185 family protein [Thiomicrospira sp.]MBE0494072.1 DUF3185 family protein [Thiomicrospira sp.]
MRIIGIVLVVIGVGLAIWGFQLSDSISSEVTQAITGAEADKVMFFYIGGAISLVVGLYLFIRN